MKIVIINKTFQYLLCEITYLSLYITTQSTKNNSEKLSNDHAKQSR